MFAVILLHCVLQRSQSAMYTFTNRYVNFSRSSPKHNDTCTVVVCLKFTNVFSQLFHHIPTGSTILHIVSIQAFGVVTVKSSLHRHNLFQFIFHRIDILFTQHLAVDSRLIRISRIYIPCTKNNVIQFGHRHNFIVMQIFLCFPTSYTNLIILRH